MIFFCSIFCLFVCFSNFDIFSCDAMDTGFWYRETRPPFLKYDTVPYANLTVKIKRPVQGGPGQNLMTDPEDPTKTLYTGNTINRQSSHSLRIGGASALAAAGSSDREIMILGRWKSLVFLNYVRSSQLSSSRSMKLIVDPRSFTTLDIHRLSKR